MTSHSLDTIRPVLHFIPPDLARDEWASVAMALKSEFGPAGFELFDEWSARAENYSATNSRDTYRSVKASGGTTIGTLFHLAKAHGYKPDAAHKAPAPTPEEHAKRNKARRETEQREKAERVANLQRAKATATKQWHAASEQGQSEYLARKAVSNHGGRFDAKGRYIVPMRDAAGELCATQTIEADGSKKFTVASSWKGLLHWIGNPLGCAVALICEGYATGAALHEATRLPVVVGFTAGNLEHVARIVRGQHPDAAIVICGDDDHGTEARTGKNPGRLAATEAAHLVRGAAVFPEGLPDGGTDFQDLAAHAGADTVRAMIEPAIEAAKNARTARARSTPNRAKKTAPAGRNRAAGALDDADEQATRGDRFTVDDDGVFFRVPNDDDGGRRRVCDPLHVVALARDTQGNGWALLVEFKTPDTDTRRLLIPLAALAGDGAEWRRSLLHAGFIVPTDTNRRRWLTEYLISRRTAQRVRLVERMGWHLRAYVLPRETIGDANGEQVVFHTDAPIEDTLTARGALWTWQKDIARHCIGNSRLIFAVCIALAGPMLHPAGEASGGFNLRGTSSIGKSTLLRVGASVYGGPRFMRNARGTDNAQESLAVLHSDLCLFLDEFGQLDPRIAGEVAYLLANQQAKSRSTRTGQARPTLTWRLLFVTSAEVTLQQHMAEAGKRSRAGQELRIVDVPADAGRGCGVFEDLHEFANGASMSRHLVNTTDKQYGTAGQAWLEWAVDHVDELPALLRELIDRMSDDWIPEAAGGQVYRVGRRFALIAAAGELATRAGITGWAEGEATKGVRECFHAWLASRGGIGNAEEGQMLRQVRRFLELHGESRFHWWHRAADDRSPNTPNRAGFRKLVSEAGKEIASNSDHMREFGEIVQPRDGEGAQTEYFVLGEVMRGEVCEGFDPAAVFRVLIERGHLMTEKTSGRPDRKERLPGIGPTRCYRIKPSIFDDDGEG